MWDETAQLDDIAEVEILLQNGNTHYLDTKNKLVQFFISSPLIVLLA